MKRDWNKIREILENIEDGGMNQYYNEDFEDLPKYIEAEGNPGKRENIKRGWQHTIEKNLAVLQNAGLVDGEIRRDFGEDDKFPHYILTFKGYDLLEIMRSKYWQGILNQLKEHGVTYEGIMVLHRHYITAYN